MSAFWFWVIVAIAFAVAEVLTVAFFAVFLTIGALGAAVGSLLGFGLLVQAIVLGVLGVAGIMIARPFLVERLHIGRPALRSGASTRASYPAARTASSSSAGSTGDPRVTWAHSVVRLTLASITPSTFERPRSTRRTQEAQVIPATSRLRTAPTSASRCCSRTE